MHDLRDIECAENDDGGAEIKSFSYSILSLEWEKLARRLAQQPLKMDDYPQFSLDHNIPLLVTLGVAPDSSFNTELEPELKEQAILLRSEEPCLESSHARALLTYIKGRDASKTSQQGEDGPRTYKFRVKSAARVSSVT